MQQLRAKPLRLFFCLSARVCAHDLLLCRFDHLHNPFYNLVLVDTTPQPTKAIKNLYAYLADLHTYIKNNAGYIRNYGERYRNGERISTGFVESTINQVVSKRFCKKQQMRWTKRGAHLLLQTRTKVLNDELEDTFRVWYPQFRAEDTGMPRAA